MLTVAITLGDPAGIGPEIVARSLAPGERPKDARLLVLGNPALLKVPNLHIVASVRECVADAINVWPVAADVTPEPGKPSVDTGRAALAAIDLGLKLALAREVDALATAPVSKRTISESGTPFIGHTEYLAARAQVRHPVMFFTSEKIRVALVTTHLALKKVPGALTADRIVETVAVTHDALRRYFGVMEPKLAVSALNPHAGEGGQFGREEIDIIAPSCAAARARGFAVTGPLPGDTIFRRVMSGEFDAAVSMYHDQALGPVKTLDRAATNVTLGLPFIRTSVDHGTAFEIAGTGKADPAPMRGCIQVACDMAHATAALL